MHATAPPSAGRRRARARAGGSAGLLVLAFLAFTAVVASAAYAYHRAYARVVRAEGEQELETIARLKVEQISALLRERLGDGRSIYENPGMSRASWPLLEKHDTAAVKAHLAGWFGPLASHYRYDDVVVLDDGLRVMARLEEGAAELPRHSRAVAERALRERRVLLSEPEREPGTNALMFDVAVPLAVRDGARPDRIVGVLLLRAAVKDTLQPIVDSWPTPSASGELLIASRDGDRVVFLTESARAASARPDSLPMSRTELVAVRAVAGDTGVIEGRDGTGAAVLAAVQRVPGTDWSLVAKLDLVEVMAPVKHADRTLGLAVLALLAGAAVSLVIWRRHQLASSRRDASARETERLERQFDALFERGNDAVLLVDDSCRVVAANQRAAELYGWAKSDLPGRTAGEIAGRNDADVESSFRSAHERGGVVIERIHRRRDGTAIPVEASIQSYPVDGVRHAVAILRDVSERRRDDAQLRLSERLTAMGALAAGVAHEINNPVSFVLGNVEWALEHMGEDAAADPAVVTALEEARDGARRVQAIVRDLKTFSRAEPEQAVRGPVDVLPALRSSLNIVHNQIRHRARLVTDLQPVPLVDASEQRLGQVFLNLLVNAAQAIPRNAAAQHDVHVGTRAAPDGSVVVEVRDTGVGMAPEVMRRVFDPFFTTKSGEGTGLGLSIADRIVTSLGGRIEVESDVGHGSTFRVVLPPATAAAAVAPTDGAGEGDGEAPGGRVLVVDDEPLVASSMARILGRNHQVATVTSARDALSRLEAGERFDVILCDLMMPDMTGMELWAALARLRPGLEQRMVFITGGTFTERAREFLESTSNEWIEKPFEPGSLREVVADHLRRTRAARTAP